MESTTIAIREHEKEPSKLHATSFSDILTYLRNTRVDLSQEMAQKQIEFETKYFRTLPTEDTTTYLPTPMRLYVIVGSMFAGAATAIAGVGHLVYKLTSSEIAQGGAVVGSFVLVSLLLILAVWPKRKGTPTTNFESLPDICDWRVHRLLQHLFVQAADGATCTEIQKRSDGDFEVFFTGFEPSSLLRHRLTVCDSQDEAISFAQSFYDDYLLYLLAAAGAAIGGPIAIPFFIANGASPLWSIPLLLLSGIGIYVLVSGTPRFLNLKTIWHLAKESSGEDKLYNISRLIALAHDINIDVTITEHQNGNEYSGSIVCKYKRYRVEIPVDLAIEQGTGVEGALSSAQALKDKLRTAISSESEIVKMLKQDKPVIDKDFDYTVQV
jgi:hypothetical protein